MFAKLLIVLFSFFINRRYQRKTRTNTKKPGVSMRERKSDMCVWLEYLNSYYRVLRFRPREAEPTLTLSSSQFFFFSLKQLKNTTYLKCQYLHRNITEILKKKFRNKILLLQFLQWSTNKYYHSDVCVLL